MSIYLNSNSRVILFISSIGANCGDYKQPN